MRTSGASLGKMARPLLKRNQHGRWLDEVTPHDTTTVTL
jgi:hypothetical protein